MELVPDDVGNLNCQETWDRIPQLVYGSFTNVTQFVIPFTTIIICYAKIIIRNISRISNYNFIYTGYWLLCQNYNQVLMTIGAVGNLLIIRLLTD